jgi:hypothetical protein
MHRVAPVSDKSLAVDAWESLFRAQVTVLRQLNAEFPSAELSFNEYDVLFNLTRQPEHALRIRDLNRHLLLTQPSVSRLVDRLVQRALVTKESDPGDGRGTIAAHFELDGAANTARGQVHLDSDQIQGRFQELELGGRLKLEAVLASRDLKGREFALNGTKLDFDRVSYYETGAKEASPADWWARLRLNEGSMTWARPLALHSRFDVQMKDSGLLLNLVAQRKTFLHWFSGVLTVEDVTARGDLAFREGAIVVDPLRVEGGKLDLRTRLRYSREHKTADLFVRFGKLATGVALRDGKRDFKILGPEEWFEKREGWEKR